jgi:hypothetical protein
MEVLAKGGFEDVTPHPFVAFLKSWPLEDFGVTAHYLNKSLCLLLTPTASLNVRLGHMAVFFAAGTCKTISISGYIEKLLRFEARGFA